MKKFLHIVGHIVPVIPLVRCLRNTDRRFYTFVEQPLIGIVITPISLLFANWVTGLPTEFSRSFILTSLEVYVAYQVASIVRDGVNTEQTLNPKIKVLLNWFYSALSYIVFTAGAKLANAHTREEFNFAISLIIFSILWPVFSQITNTYIWTPLMFTKFPKRTLLAVLFDKKIPTKQLMEKAAGDWDMRWILWYRQKHSIKHPRYQQLEYWGIKTLVACVVAVLMTTLYFIARWSFVNR